MKSLNIKVGISIKPNTDISVIKDYLEYLDLVLVMSVEPGCGGQTFIDNTQAKIDKLKQLRDKNNYHYLIEVDGGVNDKTISKCINADIVVSGSYVTNNNYEDVINKLKQV